MGGKGTGYVSTDYESELSEDMEAEEAVAYSRQGCPPCTAKGGKHMRIPSVYLITSPSRRQYVGQTVWPRVRINREREKAKYWKGKA